MKLKQKIAFSLAIFYMVSVIGFALSLHFCGGKLENVQLFSHAVSCKLCKDIPAEKIKDDGCCKNTSVTVKVKDSHQTQIQSKLPKLFSIELFFRPVFFNIVQKLRSAFLTQFSNKAPPLSARLALHLFNCIFRN
ncbi:HYC_CC_PP family protein [Pedobacter sp. MW01-1-1]|uniref:HYC_CC_PP family protein n=1 Tax=Pedobacter sp. MW01-1-1 TaxID=3383027 RepID=UPI003FF07BE2